MSIPFESLYEKIRELSIRTMDRYNYRRIALDMYLGQGLIAVHGSGDRIEVTDIRERKEIKNEAELEDLLVKNKQLEVVRKMRQRPPTILLSPSKDVGGPYYELQFEANTFLHFKKWFFSKEEREVRSILKSIDEKTRVCTIPIKYESTLQSVMLIELSARDCSRNYDEMLGILRCIDELYTITITRDYHDPSHSPPDKETRRKFILPEITVAYFEHFHSYFPGHSRLWHLFFDMLICKNKYGSFTLEDDLLCPIGPDNTTSRRGIGGRTWIGIVEDKKFSEEKNQPYTHYELYANIVPIKRKPLEAKT